MPVIQDSEGNVVGEAYCTMNDLLVGDIEYGSRVDPYKITVSSAREIDSRIGHLYSTPINLTALPTYQQVKVARINAMLASGRIIMAMATPTEGDETHNYGRYLVDEANKELEEIKTGTFPLGSQSPQGTRTPTAHGPIVGNQDASSRVEDFYGEFQGGVVRPGTVAYWGQAGG